MHVQLAVNLGDLVVTDIHVVDHMSEVDSKMKNATYHELPIPQTSIYRSFITKEVLERLNNPKGVWIYTDDQ